MVNRWRETCWYLVASHRVTRAINVIEWRGIPVLTVLPVRNAFALVVGQDVMGGGKYRDEA